MEQEFITLFFIVLAAYVCPILAELIPRKLVPETVFFLVAGIIIGPNCLGVASTDAAVTLLSDLGLGFLFLLAGFEIDPKMLTGKQGRRGFVTWLITLAIAIGVVALVPSARENPTAWMAVAIALTTTAFGTIVPIMQERGLTGTPIGNAIVSYGTWGELCPIIAIALVLSTRKTWVTLAILAAFAIIAVVAAVLPKRLWEKSERLERFIAEKADTNAQITVRFVMVLLVGLVAISAVFDLDIVMGAFAAGFVLRYLMPEGNERLEVKLRGIGYGFFIPLFFIVSGMGINPAAVAARPLLLVLFIAALVVVRAQPIFVSLRIHPDTRKLGIMGHITIALYCTTALPLIVAVVSIATGAGALSVDTGSILIAAGGITVLLMPLITSITTRFVKTAEANEPALHAEVEKLEEKVRSIEDKAEALEKHRHSKD